ncbi:MAG: VWA domain-containing protein [Alicyclobacillus sp.]|nr:VWA domain-containing protein [Alicyclobacillus sp.]
MNPGKLDDTCKRTSLLGVRALSTNEATLRQILVITDGCSNVGTDPVECARQARRQNVVVNVIGIVDAGNAGKQGYNEAMSIADAGGGMCRIVQPMDLAATAQMLTHQTVQMTLQQVVNQELLQAMGKTTEELPPPERAKVMQVVDKLEEELRLDLVVAVDTSASMKEKIPTVREAIRDLVLSLQAKSGASRLAVVAFPGSGDEVVELVQPFQDANDISTLDRLYVARGGTPTGPAIDFAASLFRQDNHTITEDEYFPGHRWSGGSPASG